MSAKDPNENRPGYRETKVGWIPNDWQSRILDSVATRLTGHTPDKNVPEYWNGGVKWVSLADSDRLDQGLIRGTDKEISDLGIKNSSARLLPHGTVALLRDASVGRVGILAEEMAVSQHFVAWVCGGELENRYLYYWLLSQRRLFVRMAVGTTIVTIGMPFFAKLEVPVPPVPEQIKTAAILSTCDEAIEKTSDLIKAKQRQKKALMQQLLTGKKRLPGFEGEWTVRKLSEVLSHVFRPVDWAPDRIFHLVSIRRRSMGLFRREPLRGDEYKTTDLHELKAGDFVVSKRQVTHGALAMVTEEFDGCHVSKEYSIFVNKDPEGFHMPFFDWLSRTPRLWWLAYVASNGVVIEKLIFEPKTYLKFEVLLPPSIEEQTAITEVLDTCDRELRKLEEGLSALQQQKKALMQKLLTGQVRVKV